MEEFIEKIRDSRAVIRCRTVEETRRIINWLISVGFVYQNWYFDEDEMPITIGINPFLHVVDAWDNDDDDSLYDWFKKSDLAIPRIVNFDDCLDFVSKHENMISDILADLPAELI